MEQTLKSIHYINLQAFKNIIRVWCLMKKGIPLLCLLSGALALTLTRQALAQEPDIECTTDNGSSGYVKYRYYPKGKSLNAGQKIRVERKIFPNGQDTEAWINDSDLAITRTDVSFFTTRSVQKNKFTGLNEEFLFVTRLDGLSREPWVKSDNWGVLHNSGWSVCEIKRA